MKKTKVLHIPSGKYFVGIKDNHCDSLSDCARHHNYETPSIICGRHCEQCCWNLKYFNKHPEEYLEIEDEIEC